MDISFVRADEPADMELEKPFPRSAKKVKGKGKSQVKAPVSVDTWYMADVVKEVPVGRFTPTFSAPSTPRFASQTSLPSAEPAYDVKSDRSMTPPPASSSRLSHPGELLPQDSDAQLRSSDNVEFPVHVHILKASSAYFRDVFPWHRNHGTPIAMQQDSYALGTLLHLIYPVDVKPQIKTIAELVNVLQAAKALQITSFGVHDILNSYIEAEPHPLRAWALATAFGYPKAHRDAVERYLKGDSFLLDNIPSETRLIDGQKVFQLVAAKERALKAARTALRNLELELPPPVSPRAASPEPRLWGFGVNPPQSSHSTHPSRLQASNVSPELASPVNAIPDPTIYPIWRREFIARTASMNPFAAETTSDAFVELLVLKSEPNNPRWWSTISQDLLSVLRGELKDIISLELRALALV